MRLLKVLIKRGDIGKDEDMMVYPARYNAVEVDRMGHYATAINPANVSLSGEIGRGGIEEYCIIALPDTLAVEYAQDPDMAIIDSTEADTLMESWRLANGAPEETIKEPARITAIRAKLDAGLSLSQSDLDALDPEKSEGGINKTRRPVAERIKIINDDLATLPLEQKEIQKGSGDSAADGRLN